VAWTDFGLICVGAVLGFVIACALAIVLDALDDDG